MPVPPQVGMTATPPTVIPPNAVPPFPPAGGSTFAQPSQANQTDSEIPNHSMQHRPSHRISQGSMPIDPLQSNDPWSNFMQSSFQVAGIEHDQPFTIPQVLQLARAQCPRR